ncbi:metallophosphoesterase [Paenibacillus sp. CF384]|uniref:metallophosphoesterase n=1 Tax=Paenibacillus sp. CF384 TaxID=1884382 RepID=UPI0008988046|nr:metallophosphoesterase [Paenibacillus sp. CF384]SDW31465.1 Predicted phosphohydrolase, MPP superfamily [Paenibacillus sp. CF384]
MLIWISALAAALIVLVAAVLVRTSYQYTLDRQTVIMDRLPSSFDGTTLLLITDIHRRSLSDEVIDGLIAAGGADLVLIGGDLRERRVPLARSRRNIKQLARIAPVYMVYGNHDYDEDMRPLEVMLTEERVRLLVNEAVVLEQRDGSRIRLAGVDDPRLERDRLDLALSDPAADAGSEPLFTIVLAHDPILLDRMNAQQKQEVDLVLSGHTHGGQIALPYIGPVLRGTEDSGYWRGWFDFSAQQTTGASRGPRLFVSCGYGTSRLPIRLLVPAQYHLITLRSAAVPQALSQSLQDQ